MVLKVQKCWHKQLHKLLFEQPKNTPYFSQSEIKHNNQNSQTKEQRVRNHEAKSQITFDLDSMVLSSYLRTTLLAGQNERIKLGIVYVTRKAFIINLQQPKESCKRQDLQYFTFLIIQKTDNFDLCLVVHFLFFIYLFQFNKNSKEKKMVRPQGLLG